MRLVILAEGDTEASVLKGFLQPFCSEFASVEIINLRGSGKIISEFQSIAETALNSDSEAFVFCLIDLHEIPLKFPRAVYDEPNLKTAMYGYIQRYMNEKIPASLRDRFFAFPVVMEIETWLLADQAVLHYFSNQLQPPHAPEDVAQPAEQLKGWMKQHKQRDYSKTAHGQLLFERASAERVYNDNCPHFELLVNQLLRIQEITPPKDTPSAVAPDHDLFVELADVMSRYEDFWQRVEQQGDLTESDLTEHDELETQMEQINQRIGNRHQGANDQ